MIFKKNGHSPVISKYKKGEKDSQNNRIEEIISCGNEFIVYEIDTPDIGNKLHVCIDGYNKESENRLCERYASIKSKYMEAKGLLYRSENYGLMKHRVGSTLGTVLLSDNIDGIKEFDKLIDQIKSERIKSIIGRLFYILPALISVILISTILLYKMEWRIENLSYWHIVCILFGSIFGGTLSILYSLKNRRFEEYIYWYYYLMVGFERIFLSIVAGTVAYVLFNSGIIFPEFDSTNYWAIILIMIFAGFSEAFIPSVLDKISKSKQESKVKDS